MSTDTPATGDKSEMEDHVKAAYVETQVSILIKKNAATEVKDGK